ncbi:MAG TPA: hypothetical protein VKB93_16105 [Thermoanaerobaculia bacterium]|nr:hypothetical protein [Thermoanaerobaculia bacterium]
MFTVEHHVGKLFEVRLATPITEDEFQVFMRELGRVLGVPGKYVGVTDLIDAHIFPAYVTQTMIQYLSASSPRVVRSAMLVNDGATFGMQVERVLRSSNSTDRRSFRKPEELETWLAEVLTVEERVRLRRFLTPRLTGMQPHR